jgi:transposase
VPPAPQQKELAEFQNGDIVALSHHENNSQIGSELLIPRQTISSSIQRYNIRQSSQNLHQSGRPRKTSATADRWLVREALTEATSPLKELKSICNISLSTRTIQRRLRKEGIRKWKAAKRALLTKYHAKQRL